MSVSKVPSRSVPHDIMYANDDHTKFSSISTRGLDERTDSGKRRKEVGRMYEDRHRNVHRPVNLRDMLVDDSESEDGGIRILLTGKPLVGRSCVGQTIAHEWAASEAGNPLNSVYFLDLSPASGENHGEQRTSWNKFIGAVMRENFPDNAERDPTNMRTMTEDDLRSKDTLLIVDATDADDNARNETLEQSKHCRCKQLLLGDEQDFEHYRVDRLCKCLGLTDAQLKENIRYELRDDPDAGDDLLSFLHTHQELWSLAQHPIGLHVLCSKWHKAGAESKDGSMAFVWSDVYMEVARTIQRKKFKRWSIRRQEDDQLFQSVDEKAFGMISGRPAPAKPSESPEGEGGGTREAIDKIIGPLLVTDRASNQMTFAKVFGGRFIARLLMTPQETKKDKVKEFISKRKYSEEHRSTLNIVAEEISRKYGAAGLSALFSAMDEPPKEWIGLKHLLLKMKLLERALAANSSPEILDSDPVRCLLHLFVMCLREVENDLRMSRREFENDLRMSDILRTHLRQMPLVCRHFPPVTKVFLDAVGHGLPFTVEKFKRLTKVISCFPEVAHKVKGLLAKECNDNSFETRKRAMAFIAAVAEDAPTAIPEVLDFLKKGAEDPNAEVKRAALQQIGTFASAMPQQIERLVTMLLCGLDSEERSVCNEALRQMLACSDFATSVQKRRLFQKLSEPAENENWQVRAVAMQQIGGAISRMPESREELLVLVRIGLEDPEEKVQLAALAQISDCMSAAEDHQEVFAEVLEKKSKDRNRNIRLAVMKQLATTVRVAPHLESRCLELLKGGLRDTNTYVYEAAARQISGLASDCQDKKAISQIIDDARENVALFPILIEQLSSLALSIQEREKEFFFWLDDALTDDKPDVQEAAMKQLASFIAVSPQLASWTAKHLGKELQSPAKGAIEYARVETIRKMSLKELFAVAFSVEKIPSSVREEISSRALDTAMTTEESIERRRRVMTVYTTDLEPILFDEERASVEAVENAIRDTVKDWYPRLLTQV